MWGVGWGGCRLSGEVVVKEVDGGEWSTVI